MTIPQPAPIPGACTECGSAVPEWRHFRGCSRDTTPAPATDPVTPVAVAVPRVLTERMVRGYLAHLTEAPRYVVSVAPKFHVRLDNLQTAWRPDGGQFVGPGVVHYIGYRDGGIGGYWIPTTTVDDVAASIDPPRMGS